MHVLKLHARWVAVCMHSVREQNAFVQPVTTEGSKVCAVERLVEQKDPPSTAPDKPGDGVSTALPVPQDTLSLLELSHV